MGKRGRKSSASLEVLTDSVEAISRQKAPPGLNDDEIDVWISVVNTQPADWFSDATAPLLAEYCRHVVHARRVAQLIEKATADPNLAIEDYDRLLKMAERESRAIATLATKMRIAQQSTSNHRGHSKPTITNRPWAS